jgi:hypothetical protein
MIILVNVSVMDCVKMFDIQTEKGIRNYKSFINSTAYMSLLSLDGYPSMHSVQ